MSDTDLQTLLAFFKTLANESRLKLVGLLAQREHSVEELAALLQLKEPTVSHHLNKLKDLNLVTMRPDGNIHFYRLHQSALRSLTKSLLSPSQLVSLTNAIDPTDWEAKVIRTYVENGQLREIPASRKKRWVILKWLVAQFERDRHYSEKELNALIKPIHPDTATLRREMIGYRMMQREQGVYWRLPETEWRDELNLNL